MRPRRGEASSKRAAEKAAALALLEREELSVVTRAGFVAVIGAPNAGKSTLVNRLVGSKVTIVTQKVQTTRFPVRGVAIEGRKPRSFWSTPPASSRPRRRLDRAMVRAAWAPAPEDADAVVHLIDARKEAAADEPHRGDGSDPRDAEGHRQAAGLGSQQDRPHGPVEAARCLPPG